jgi:hypothetical protein
MAAAAAMMSDPFDKTNLLDKCCFLYPNFDRKKHVMAKPCAHWLISAPVKFMGSDPLESPASLTPLLNTESCARQSALDLINGGRQSQESPYFGLRNQFHVHLP